MISANKYFAYLFLFFLAFSQKLLGDTSAFSVTAPAPTGAQYNQELNGVVADLKLRAITDYLQKYLGSRYKNFEELVTPEFAEKYILDYKIGKSTNDRNIIEVTGHLDADSLKRWIRLTDTKSRGGNALRPVFLFTSTMPGYTFTTGDSPKVRESSIFQALHSLASTNLQKFNVRLTSPSSARLSASQPAKSESDIRALSSSFIPAGFNTALWFHLTPCKTCGGSRLETYYYNLAQNRILISRADDLAMEPKNLASADRFKKLVQPLVKQFQSDFEGLSSSGELFGTVYHVTVEGIETNRAYKAIELELSRLDSLSHSQLVRVEFIKKLADFEVTSQLSLEELKESLKQTDFARANLRITVR